MHDALDRPRFRPGGSAAALLRKPAVIQDDDGTFNLPGGTPEAWDADLTATLVREAFEENQVRVGETASLGSQEVHRPGRAPYAQARMAGVVQAFAERAAGRLTVCSGLR